MAGAAPAHRAHKGLFITLEGGEGAGKSLQLDALARELERAGRHVVCTREPGGTPLGERLREVLLDLSSHGPLALDALSETLLFVAARAELVAQVIAPALNLADIVLCDRFADSTRAYQGYGRGVDLTIIEQVNAAATRGLVPDLTVLLDLPPATGLERTGADGQSDRFGREELSFHERVRDGYRKLAAAEPERWLVVDATHSVTQITQAICARLEPLLARG